jgi:flagellar basal-body rod protein FlgC
MSSVMSIGLSAMHAAELRLQAAASNIANAQSNGRAPSGAPRPGDVYRPVSVVQREAPGGGVSASLSARSSTFSLIADPNSPFADANGQVASPDVDLASELIDVIIAKYQFVAAVKLVQVGSDMQTTTINTLA